MRHNLAWFTSSFGFIVAFSFRQDVVAKVVVKQNRKIRLNKFGDNMRLTTRGRYAVTALWIWRYKPANKTVLYPYRILQTAINFYLLSTVSQNSVSVVVT